MIKWISNNDLDFTREFSKMDSYCVTIVSSRKSSGTISGIKHFDCIRDVQCNGSTRIFIYYPLNEKKWINVFQGN